MTVGIPALASPTAPARPVESADGGVPVALLRRAVALTRDGDHEAGRVALRKLADAFPCWDEPRLRLAQTLREDGDFAAAEAAYQAVLEINPGRPEALLGLGALYMQRGEPVRAQSLLVRCCGIVPGQADVWDALGVSLLMTGDPATAETAFAEAQRLAPLLADYALHRAEAALAAGTGEAELARAELASGQDPTDIALLCERGVLLDRLGRRAEAADILEAAAALAPDAAVPAVLLGRVLATLSRPRDAEAALARAIELDPDNPQPRNDRAVMLIRMQRYAEARELLRELVETHGRDPAVLCNLANATVALGDQVGAERLAEEAVALAPDAVLPWRTLCNALPYRAGIGGDELLASLRECARRLPRAPAPPWTCGPDPDRRLRIGLLSGSLKTHPVGWLTIAGFEALDPAAFEIVCLAQDGADDPLARRFRALASGWHEVSGLDDAALASFARGLSIDVLIELGGYGEAGRMPACAFRLAPVQVKWVGMQNHGTGLPEMDWFLTDRWETPVGFEHFYDERLLRLPDGYVCYSPPAHAPDAAPLPALANGFVTFGCFNNLAKITPTVIATWARILRELPTARLILKTHQFADPGTRDRIHTDFARHGVEPLRIELQGASGHRQFLAQYNRVDLVLDPFPYSGGLTTCEALWMGVPTVTLPGETFASRHSTSHMCNVGLADWVAADVEDYIALAARKAADVGALAELRAELRPRMRASPLCDAPRFGRGLGAALRHTWRDWCNRQTAAPDRTTALSFGNSSGPMGAGSTAPDAFSGLRQSGRPTCASSPSRADRRPT
jgi:protein O-GlcNAc transferase